MRSLCPTAIALVLLSTPLSGIAADRNVPTITKASTLAELACPDCDTNEDGVVDSLDLLLQIEALDTSFGSANYLNHLVRNAQLYVDRGNNVIARARFSDVIAETVRLSNLNPKNLNVVPLTQANAFVECVVKVMTGVDLPKPHVPGSGLPKTSNPIDPPIVR